MNLIKKLELTKKKIIFAIAWLILTAVVIFGAKGMFYTFLVDDYNDGSGTETVISASDEICQYFSIDNPISRLNLLMQNDGDATETIYVEVCDAQSQTVICESPIDVAPTNDRLTSVEMLCEMDASYDGKDVYMTIKPVTDCTELYLESYEGSYSEEMYVDGKEMDVRGRFSVVYSGHYIYSFAVLCALIILLFGWIFVMPDSIRKKPERLFLIIAIVAGLGMAAMTPDTQECDGPDHFARAMDVSYGNLFGSFTSLTHAEGEIKAPANFREFDDSRIFVDTSAGYARLVDYQSKTFSKEPKLFKYNGSVTTFVYWPQGLGLWIGRMLQLSMHGNIFVAKIFNLAAFIALMYLAIKHTPCGKNVFMALGLLPLTLFQAASLSQDSVLNGVGFLFTALCLKYALDEKRRLSWKQFLLLGALLFVMFLSKYVYVALGLFVFMIPMSRFKNKLDYLKSVIIGLLPLIIGGGFALMRNISGILGQQDVAVSPSGEVTQSQLGLLLHQPTFAVHVLVETLTKQLSTFFETMNVLGSLNLNLGLIMVLCPCIIAVIGALDVNHQSVRIDLKSRILMLAGILITFLMILFGLYIGDSRINEYAQEQIYGVQGRYFLILIPALLLSLSSKRVKNDIRHFTVKVAAVNVAMLIYAFYEMLRGYY